MIVNIEIVVQIKQAVQTVMNQVLVGAIPPTWSVRQSNVTLMVILKAGSGVKLRQLIIWQVSHLKEFVINCVVCVIIFHYFRNF